MKVYHLHSSDYVNGTRANNYSCPIVIMLERYKADSIQVTAASILIGSERYEMDNELRYRLRNYDDSISDVIADTIILDDFNMIASCL
jgi:hypothetical protein